MKHIIVLLCMASISVSAQTLPGHVDVIAAPICPVVDMSGLRDELQAIRSEVAIVRTEAVTFHTQSEAEHAAIVAEAHSVGDTLKTIGKNLAIYVLPAVAAFLAGKKVS